MIKVKYLLTLLLLCCTVALPLMDEDIGEAIFQNNQVFLIYVCNQPIESIINTLDEFCVQKILCTMMSSEVQMYDRLKEFVGMPTNQYLLLLDVQNRAKYTLSIQNGNISQIANFYHKFVRGELERYYTSQSLPVTESDPHLQKLVGLNFQQFVNISGKVKVVYLYTQSQLCDNCYQIYQRVVEAAKKFTNREQIVFGHFDLFKNEHKLIQQEVVPLVLVYDITAQNVRKIEPENIDNLDKIIAELLEKRSEEDL